MSDYYCSDCKSGTSVVFDYSSGETICSECGLLLESCSIDQTSGWSTSADAAGDVALGGPVNNPLLADAVLGGPVNNPLLADAALTTIISKGSVKEDKKLSRLQNRDGYSDRALKMISTVAEKLSLVTTIEDRAKKIFKRLKDQKYARGANLYALVVASFYIACRREGKPCTIKEICITIPGANKKKEIYKAKTLIVKHLKVKTDESMEMRTINAGDYLRFCSTLGMSNEEIKAVQETVQKAENLDIRRTPVSIAAAIIFMINQLSDSKKPLLDVSLATTVCKPTIKNVFKELCPHAVNIIPKWFLSGKNRIGRFLKYIAQMG